MFVPIPISPPWALNETPSPISMLVFNSDVMVEEMPTPEIPLPVAK